MNKWNSLASMKEAGNGCSEDVEQRIPCPKGWVEMIAHFYSPWTEFSGLSAFMGPVWIHCILCSINLVLSCSLFFSLTSKIFLKLFITKGASFPVTEFKSIFFQVLCFGVSAASSIFVVKTHPTMVNGGWKNYTLLKAPGPETGKHVSPLSSAQ